jgi:neopullulanase
MSGLMKYGLIFLFFSTTAFAQTSIQHVEPLNWWVGMQDSNLQLMVHGNDIGETTPAIRYPGVSIEKIHTADSKNYLFLDLRIKKTAQPGAMKIDFTKNGKVVDTYSYTLLARQPNAASTKGFTAADVVYLITPDRFANGDPGNDAIAGMKENKVNRSAEGGRHGGDIRGIINHLDYIADMGFTAIWPTPVLENDMPEYSYHGYAITHHYKVDPRFGTLDEYRELATKAREKGIKLIFDHVLNHTGSHYWWMKDLPFKNWLNHQDSFVLTTHRRTTNQDLYASQFDKDLMTNGWFWKTMPDMNGQNPFMANYLIQNSIWWIETLQLGGIRQDTYGYSDKSLLSNWSCRIMAEYPNFSIVGEEWSLNPLITSYWQKGKQNHHAYRSCLTDIMDFPLQSALIQALTEPEGSDFGKGMTRIYEALANDFVYADPNRMLVFGDNHDMDRLFTQLGKNVDLTKMALTYLLTIRGIPQIYYGTEVLLDNSTHRNNHGVIRSDFPGGWDGDAVNAFSGKGLTNDQLDVQTYLKKLLNWRKNAPVIHCGKTLHFAPFGGVYVYFRFDDTQTIMVVLNSNNQENTIDCQRFAEILKTRTTAANVLTGEKIDLSRPLRIGGKSAMVLEIIR